MIIGIPKETEVHERRVAATPESVTKLCELEAEVVIESGLGASISASDATYRDAGATICENRETLIGSSDIQLRVRKPPSSEVAAMKDGCIHISYLNPFSERSLVDQLAKNGITSVSMEMLPRITRAQKMDALSSQASLAGYAAVITAAGRLSKILPMMITPSGTIQPSRVFVIGAGVAGLQAIATAKRLGARVDAFDTRPAVKEQVESLGGRFVEIDLGATSQTQDGYAKALTREQIAQQQSAMKKTCAQSDIIITTAQVFGKPAPRLVTRELIECMKPGSVIVDMAVETGGNVEGSEFDREVEVDGVLVVGIANLPATVAVHASQMYSNNLFYFVQEFWDSETRSIDLRPDDEIVKRCVITRGGSIVNESVKESLQ